jgi:hypothetical protein
MEGATGATGDVRSFLRFRVGLPDSERGSYAKLGSCAKVELLLLPSSAATRNIRYLSSIFIALYLETDGLIEG